MTDFIGHYEIIGELGRGAMAIVWRAWDPRLEREVALKEPLMPPGVDSDFLAELARRFVREGAAAARLNHPGIVAIYAADVYDGRPAIVMELVEGQTLGGILASGRLQASGALLILDQLLDAVGYAHTMGVVHRDIKPDNVFVSKEGRVKLADFGIAGVGENGTLDTGVNTVMGTPGYMAPEQVAGWPIDARADIFAVGTVAYEMLTGQHPFGASRGAASTTVMYDIVHEDPPPIPDAPVAGLAADPRPAILWALAKDPECRPESAAAFRSALIGGSRAGAAAWSSAPSVVGAAHRQPPGAPVPRSSPTPMPLQQPASPIPSFEQSMAPQRAKSGSPWWPYALVGGLAVSFIVLLLMFAGGGGGGGASGGGGGLADSPSSETSASAQVQPPGPTVGNVTQFCQARASSQLAADGGSDYGPSHLLDGDRATAWAEGVPGDGRGESVVFTFDEPMVLTAMKVIPGYDKSYGGWDRWWSNGRLRRVELTFSDGSTELFGFPDVRGWQVLRLGGKETQSVEMTIMLAYPPQPGPHRAYDTSVSEVRFLGWPLSEGAE